MGLMPSKFKEKAKDNDLDGDDRDNCWDTCKWYMENEGQKDCPTPSCPAPSCPASSCPTPTCPTPTCPTPTCPAPLPCPEQEEQSMIMHYAAYGASTLSIACLILIIIVVIAALVYNLNT